MRHVRFVPLIVVGLGCLLSFPAVVRAQSAIAGTVRDAQGLVLPGVTVEATSPVLIEKSHTVVTDGQGQYQIVDLRPGTYSLSFSLEGFTLVKREGLELPANFTMTLNAEMSVGTLQETLTVSGRSPVVDVQTNTKQQVLSRDVLDAVPTAHTIQGIGQIVVGVALTAPDVGGSQAMQQTYFSVHGTGREQTVVTVDGQLVDGMMYDGGVQPYFLDSMTQETVYQTGGGTGEALTGGLKLNLVPREGGNQFSGSGFISYESGAWQSNNLTSRLQSLGVVTVDKIDKTYDNNIAQGGPILQSKVWFFATARMARFDKPVANTSMPDGSQGISDELLDAVLGRLTWQVSPRSKLSSYMDFNHRFRGHAMSPGDDPLTSSVVWHTPLFLSGAPVKWFMAVSNRLLIEAGLSFDDERYDNKYQPGLAQPYNSAAWYAGARHVDNGFSTTSGASAYQYGNYPNRYYTQASMSYVTGSHNAKVGFLNSWGTYKMWATANADLYQNYTNGSPVSVTALNTPTNWEEDLNSNFGLYGQDAWRINRMTLSLGLRYDRVSEQIGAEPAQTGRFVSQPAHDAILLPTWNSLSPRVAAVFDLFGNGKTALRIGYNRFETASATGVAQVYDPSAVTTSSTLSWTDLNKDNIAQGNLGCVYLTPGCEINLAQLPKTFGLLTAATFDPSMARPYQMAFNVGAQHELAPGMSISVDWFHTDFKNLMVRNNVLRTAADYTAVSVVSPKDGSVITAYNVSAAKVSAVQYVDSTDPNLKQWYNGIELNFNARLPHGIRIFGGSATDRTISNSCSAASTNPNILIYCDGAQNGIPWRTQFKLAGTVPLPWWGIQVSGSFQALPGYLLGTQPMGGGFVASATGLNTPNGQGTYWQITPTTKYAANCTGPCTPGALVIPGLTTSTLLVPLVAPGSELTPRVNQLDFTVTKWFTRGSFKVGPKIDLFNALNSDDYYTVRTLLWGGSTYLQPGSVLQGRIIRLAADVKW